MRPKKAKRLKGGNKNPQDISNHMLTQAFDCFKKGDFLKTAQIGQQILQTNPNNHHAIHIMGCSAQRLGDIKTALAYLSKAAELNPNDAEYHLNYAITAMDGHILESEIIKHFRQAIALKPNYAKAYLYLGKLHVKMHRHKEAKTVFLKALSLDPDSLEIYEMLCLALERSNDLEMLEKILDQGMKKFPNDTSLMFPLAKLKIRQNDLDEATKYLEILKAQPNEKERQSTILTELARVHDAKQDYDTAFTIFMEAQKLLKEAQDLTKGPLDDQFLDIRNAVFHGIKPETISEWSNEDIEDKEGDYPPLFLVGFPRSGTTLTEQILSSHPDLLASQEASILDQMILKMANIIGHTIKFPGDLSNLTKDDIIALRKEYRTRLKQLFSEDVSSKQIIDKLPFNLVHLAFIYRIFPEAKILILLRDPRDACLSCFTQVFRRNAAMKYTNTLESTAELYDISMSTYLHFKKFIPLSMLEIRYEDITDNLEDKAREMISFLGQEWNDEVLNYYSKDKDRGISTPSYAGVMQPIYKSSVGKWKNYEKHFSESMKKLSPYIKEFGYAD